jgi:hypothetical protein
MMNALKGQIGGSIRQLSLHHETLALCSVGLDRWLRVHDSKLCSLQGKVYLKTQMTACSWVPKQAKTQEPAKKKSRIGVPW